MAEDVITTLKALLADPDGVEAVAAALQARQEADGTLVRLPDGASVHPGAWVKVLAPEDRHLVADLLRNRWAYDIVQAHQFRLVLALAEAGVPRQRIAQLLGLSSSRALDARMASLDRQGAGGAL
jgi:hypothetical protein